MFGTNKKILLKAKRDLNVISHTLTLNLWPIGVHEFFAREIFLLRSRVYRFGSQHENGIFAIHLGDPSKNDDPQCCTKIRSDF